MRRHKPRMFYINPTHHNPTGYTVPAKQRKLLVELAERYRCLLVEDDPFRDMHFEEEPPAPFLPMIPKAGSSTSAASASMWPPGCGSAQ